MQQLKQTNTMNEIIKRIMADTPTFFKRLIAIGLTIGVIGGALIEPHVASQLPDFLQKISGYMVTVGLVTAAVAKLTVKDTEVLKK